MCQGACVEVIGQPWMLVFALFQTVSHHCVCPVSWPLNFLLPCVRAGITDTCATVSGLCVGAGLELALSGLVGKYFTH